MEEIVNNKSVGEKITAVINRIQKVYLVLTCSCAIALIYRISGGTAVFSIVEAALGLFVYFMIYMGLRHRKQWIIAFILIFSVFALLDSFLSSFEQAKDVASLFGKLIDIAIALFSAYQIHFFSRKEIKESFNAKDINLY